MLNPDITLNTTLYSTTVVKPTSTVRSVPALSANTTKLMTISHESSSIGRISTAVILDHTERRPNSVTGLDSIDALRTLVKFQYNPNGSRSDLVADRAEQVAQLILFLQDSANLDKIFNQEH